jgi:hypothetical protein
MEARIVDISYRHHLGHLGSSLTTLPILDHIYKTKKPDDIVILSAGHGGMALYACLEKYEGRNAEMLFEKHGIHPHLDIENGIPVSSGSLGSAILVAVGHAFGNRARDVHVVISDGECAEGSVWEALAFASTAKLTNLKVHVNINGYSAYDKINCLSLVCRLKAFFWGVHIWFTKSPDVSFMKGLQAHYHVMSEDNKDEIIKYFNEEGFCKTASRGYEVGLAPLLDYGRSGLRHLGRYSARLSRPVC